MSEDTAPHRMRWIALEWGLRLGLGLVFALGLTSCTRPTANGPRSDLKASSESKPHAEPIRHSVIAFGVMGDLPYSRRDEIHVPEVLNDMSRVGARFALHVGDIKGSFEPCSDDLLTHRIGLFQNSAVPVVVTPGDNEWTDCHRLAAGRYDPLDRLALLRKLAWPAQSDTTPTGRASAQPASALAALFAEHQSGQPENARWSLDGLHFVTLHVVGSRNGLGQFPGSDAEMTGRMRANARWLEQALDRALKDRAQGLVIAFHANPDFGNPPGRGYQEFQALLQGAAERFKGPILLVHGDGHRFRVDQPLPGAQGHWPHVTRLEAFGWPRSQNWALVIFEAGRSPAFRIMTRAAGTDRQN